MTDENADLIEFASPPPKTLSSQQQPQQNGLSKTVRKSSQPLKSPPTNLLDITLSTENGSSNESSTQQQIVDVDDEKTMKTKKMSNEENSVKSPPPAIILRPASFDPSNENGTIVNNENNSNTGGDQTADLDIVDFDNELINVDQDFWLCDPKTASLDTNGASTTTTQLGNKTSSSNSNNKPPHDRNRAGGVKSTTTTVQQESDDQTTPQQLNPNEKEQLNGGANRGRSKNLVKWITEDFQEDKNLDKVKRTLLVTLDDISKGYNRRSRSVSTTRTPYYGNSNGMGAQNAPLMQPPPLPPSSNHYHHQYHNYNQHQYHAPSHPHPHHHQLHHQSSTNDINHHGGSRSSLHPAKSIESILNESNADVIDSNSNHHTSDIMSNRSMLGFGSAAATNSDEGIVRSGSNSTANKPSSYSSATIVKRRHDARSNGLGIGDVNSMMMTHNVENNEQENNIDTCNILPLEQTQYNDILDVQVIARMQEEALALSMMKPNIKTTARGDEVDLPPQDVLKRGTYSTATITKRVNSRSYAPANNNFYQQAGYECENNSSNRRDSASSSDQSSMSSSASNYELPYGNNLNAETQHPQFSSMTITKKQSPRKALQTATRAVEANVTPAVTPSTTAGRRSTNMSSNYKNLVKSNVNIHGIGAQRNQMMSIAASTSKVSGSGSSRSSTPSKSNVAAINSQSAPNKNDSRLPTPRTNNRLQSASTTQYQQMEMPQRSLQVAKPPIAPHHQQTPSTTGVTTAAAGGALRAAAGKSGRTPMAYGGQRSATTSIMTTATTPVVQQQQPVQPKMTTLQKQFNAKQQQQMPNNGATNGGSRNMVPRTSTSQSIASSNSSSTIASSYSSSSASSSSSANQTSIYSTTSPSSISSSSSTCSTTSSSKQLPKSTNRSESPGQSNNFIAPQQQPQQQNQQPFYINGGPTSIISPSGLLTDGPLGRRPTTTRVSAASPHRDRSVSPATGNRSSNSGSNSNLHTIQETKIPGKIATSATSRKSFLPQPVSYAQQQPIQYSTRHRESSNSPVRMSTNEISNDNMLANWKDGCF